MDEVTLDHDGLVIPGGGGMSVSPDYAANLPRHRRPPSLGGTGLDPVWVLMASDLGPMLQFWQDSERHGLVEAVSRMTWASFEAAIVATRPKWKLL